MNRLRFTLSVLFGSMALFCHAAVFASPFISPKGYQITPANGWRVNNSGILRSDVVLFASPARNFTPNLDIVVNASTTHQTLQSVSAELKKTLPLTLHADKILSEEYTNIAGEQALILYHTYSAGTPVRQINSRQIIIERNNYIYAFNCTALAENFSSYDPAFKQMMQSLHWKK